MDEFSKDIGRMTDYVTACINNQNLSVTPNDLINEMYIWFYENKKEYSFSQFKIAINNIIFKEKNNPLLIEIQDVLTSKDKVTQNYCKGCNEWMPLDMFYKWSKEYNGRPKYRSYCKKCEKEKHKKWVENNRDRYLISLKTIRKRNKKPKIDYSWVIKRMLMLT